MRQSSHLPWQRILSELLVSACNIHRNNQTFCSNFLSKNLTSPHKCFNFNNGTKCRAYPCPFSHICQSCQESHPRIKCTRVQNFQNPPNSIPTPINPKVLACEIQGYNHSLASYLVDGFTFGFKLGCIGEPSLSIHRNHNSVFNHKAVVQAKLRKEMNLGRISNPSSIIPFQNFVCSPLGLVPKKTPGEFRIIHDLSFPKDCSVTSFIPEINSTIQYM